MELTSSGRNSAFSGMNLSTLCIPFPFPGVSPQRMALMFVILLPSPRSNAALQHELCIGRRERKRRLCPSSVSASVFGGEQAAARRQTQLNARVDQVRVRLDPADF